MASWVICAHVVSWILSCFVSFITKSVSHFWIKRAVLRKDEKQVENGVGRKKKKPRSSVFYKLCCTEKLTFVSNQCDLCFALVSYAHTYLVNTVEHRSLEEWIALPHALWEMYKFIFLVSHTFCQYHACCPASVINHWYRRTHLV